MTYHDGELVGDETARCEADGWTDQDAGRVLGVKLDELKRGMRKPRKRHFDDLATEFVEAAVATNTR